MTKPDHTFFGFKPVEWGAKASLVKDVFNAVAPKYDLMNDLMSGGIHRFWKDEFVKCISPRPHMNILDMAGGTGDISVRILDRFKGIPMTLTLCDINQDMMEEGRNRRLDSGKVLDINMVCGDASRIPLPDNSVDVYTIAFGLRNVTDIPKALSEAWRVLKPGGQFLCLEFSKPLSKTLDGLYQAYSFKAIPLMGQLFGGSKESYQYLVESIAQFPDQNGVLALMTKAGLTHPTVQNLTGGIAAIHQGWKE